MRSLPVVAVMHGNSAAAPSEVARAADGLCSLVFVPVGEPDPVAADLLAAFGAVTAPADTAEAVTEVLLAHRPAGLTTFSEDALETCAVVAARLGLPGNPAVAMATTVDKCAQRARLHVAAGDDTRYRALPAGSVLSPAALRDFGLPAVAKPARGTGSRETHLLARHEPTAHALLPAVNAALAAEPFILEGLLEGSAEPGADWADYVSVELVLDGRRAHPVAVTGKVPLAAPFREQGGAVPAALPAPVCAEVRESAVRACTALGLTVGLAHVELKLTPAGPRVIEVNPRLGGLQEDLVARACGRSLIRLGLRAALGEDLAGEFTGVAGPAEPGVAWWYAPAAPAGRSEVVGVRGLREIRALPDVESARLGARPGAVLRSEHGWGEFLLLAKGYSADHEAVLRTRRQIDALLQVEYAD